MSIVLESGLIQGVLLVEVAGQRGKMIDKMIQKTIEHKNFEICHLLCLLPVSQWLRSHAPTEFPVYYQHYKDWGHYLAPVLLMLCYALYRWF